MVALVVGAGVHIQLGHIAPVVAVPLSRSGVDFVGIEFAAAEVSAEIGSDLVEVTWAGRRCGNACLGCIDHMVKISQGLNHKDRPFGVVVEDNIPR